MTRNCSVGFRDLRHVMTLIYNEAFVLIYCRLCQPLRWTSHRLLVDLDSFVNVFCTQTRKRETKVAQWRERCRPFESNHAVCNDSIMFSSALKTRRLLSRNVTLTRQLCSWPFSVGPEHMKGFRAKICSQTAAVFWNNLWSSCQRGFLFF